MNTNVHWNNEPICINTKQDTSVDCGQKLNKMWWNVSLNFFHNDFLILMEINFLKARALMLTRWGEKCKWDQSCVTCDAILVLNFHFDVPLAYPKLGQHSLNTNDFLQETCESNITNINSSIDAGLEYKPHSE